MSKDKLFFEGFLQKRKDKMKIRWARYWFRLQNTTLFFYTQKNGIASHLRGYYYIYTVQSVREVPTGDSSRGFIFEIIMTSGKRKVLAADTAALRTEWVGHLWEAMYLSTSVLSKNTHSRESEQRERGNSLVPAPSNSYEEMEMEAPPVRPCSAPTEAFYEGITADTEEEHIYGNTLQCHHGESVDEPQGPGGRSSVGDAPDGDYDVLPARNSSVGHPADADYDVLPVRNSGCGVGPQAEMEVEAEEGVYDVPMSCKMEVVHDESIYDVPNSLSRETTDQSMGEKMPGGAYWRL